MATPIYKGRGQPSPNGSGWLGSLLGGTPAYGGSGQPGQKSPVLGGSQPAYKPAVSSGASSDATCAAMDAGACGPIAIVIPRQVIETQ